MIYLMEYDSVEGQQNRHTEHVLGRKLLAFALRKNYGRDYTAGRGEGGKPVLTEVQGIHFNISHTNGLVVCGISAREIGVDTECIRPYDERLMRRICTGDEIDYIYQDSGNREKQNERFFRLWTLKESFLKATGQGIAIPMREVCFPVDEWVSGPDDIRGNIQGWRFRQFLYGGRFIVAVCENVQERRSF